MDTTHNSNPPTSGDDASQPVPNQIDGTDLEPEQDVIGGRSRSNNLKQLGIA